MSSKDLAVSARGLSKSYQLAHNANRPTTLREVIVERIKHPLGVKRQERETFWALDGVDFEIRRGESIGIIGRNGAGKSTLLKVLSRITYPTKGVLDIYGRVASLLEVGTGFHGELTGRENIFLNGSILGMSRREIRSKFDEIVAFAEVENFLDTPVKRYSSGMYVRLAFAVAAHLDPEILIVDEVLAVGDYTFQKKCLGKMQEVSGAGRTVLFVSHNLTTVSSLCQRAAWMMSGRLHLDGPASDVVEAYLSSNMAKTDYHDLRPLGRPYWINSPLRLVKLVFNNGDPVRHNAPLRIDIDYETNGKADGVSFGVSFASPGGGRILACDTDVPGERFTIAGKGAGRVAILLPEFQLQPGTYFLDIGCRSGDNVGLDYLPSFGQVEVLPGPGTPSVIVGRHEAGSVRVPPADVRHMFEPGGRARSAELVEV